MSHIDETGGDIQKWSVMKDLSLNGEQQNPMLDGKDMVISKTRCQIYDVGIKRKIDIGEK